MLAAQQLDVDEILAGIRAWIEIESPTDDPTGMARMAARVQADYEAIGVRVERIAGRDGFGDHLLAIDDRHCPPQAAEGQVVLILSIMRSLIEQEIMMERIGMTKMVTLFGIERTGIQICQMALH